MTKRFFKGHYGSTASITESHGEKPFRLRASSAGRTFYNRIYKTYRGARTALGRIGDGWVEVAKA